MKTKRIYVLFLLFTALQGFGYDKTKLIKNFNTTNQKIDTSSFFDVNNIRMGMRNTGQLIDPLYQFEWPKNSGLYTIFTGGIWVAGKVNNETRIAAVLYDTSAYLPGTIINGVPQPYENPRFKFYKIYRDDTTGTNPDYDNWPIIDGAPTSPLNTPLKKSNQNIWCVYNDSKDNTREFSTLPLSIEVQQFVYGDSTPEQIQNTVFIEFNIINKSLYEITNSYIGVWLDCDIGFFADDLVGIDTSANLAFAYNYNEEDLYYGSQPPAVGLLILKPAISGNYNFICMKDLDSLWYDPVNAEEAYNFMKGLHRNGQTIINPITNQPTHIMYSGDPLTQTGWIDTSSNDKKLLISFGPFNFQTNETRKLHFAIIVGSGENRLTSLANLKQRIPSIKSYYEEKLIRTLSFSSHNINFDTLAVGLEKSTNVKIKNTGEGIINIDSIISTNNNFFINQSNITLSPNDSFALNIKFKPLNDEFQLGKIILYHNAFKNKDTIIVQGQGVIYKPIFHILTRTISFDTVQIDSSKTIMMMVYNRGNSLLKIDSIISHNSDFTILPKSLNISAFDSSEISISYSPTLLNPEQGLALFHHNSLTTPDTVFMIGKKVISKFLPISAGWNLLSIPIKTNLCRIKNFFPQSTTNAYIYNNGYVSVDSISNGKGFWLKFTTSQIINIVGKPILVETLYVNPGWNLIGAPSYEINTENVVQIPENILISNFYRFEGTYLKSNVLLPGLGYWVKSKCSGILIFRPN